MAKEIVKVDKPTSKTTTGARNWPALTMAPNIVSRFGMINLFPNLEFQAGVIHLEIDNRR